jgi:hypothetical protein
MGQLKKYHHCGLLRSVFYILVLGNITGKCCGFGGFFIKRFQIIFRQNRSSTTNDFMLRQLNLILLKLFKFIEVLTQ